MIYLSMQREKVALARELAIVDLWYSRKPTGFTCLKEYQEAVRRMYKEGNFIEYAVMAVGNPNVPDHSIGYVAFTISESLHTRGLILNTAACCSWERTYGLQVAKAIRDQVKVTMNALSCSYWERFRYVNNTTQVVKLIHKGKL